MEWRKQRWTWGSKQAEVTSNAPPLRRYELALIGIGIVLAPLWFLHLPGLNLTITDILFMIAGGSFVFRTRSIPLIPSWATIAGILLFILAGVITIPRSPIPVQSTLDVIQYALIFFLIVPMTYKVGRKVSRRQWLYHRLWLVILGVLVATILVIQNASDMSQVSLWYGNQNQLHWVLASGAIIGAAIATDSTYQTRTRIMTALSVIPVTYIIVGSYTISAVLLLMTGIWVLGLRLVRWARTDRYQHTLMQAYLLVTIAVIGVGIAGAVIYWDVLWVEGNIGYRLAQYQAALIVAYQTLPLGAGFQSAEVLLMPYLPEGSATSVHNIILSHLIEVGIPGTVGFLIYMGAWFRDVSWPAVSSYMMETRADIAPTAIFIGIIPLMLFQPAPVYRFFWITFALGWSISAHTWSSQEGRPEAIQISTLHSSFRSRNSKTRSKLSEMNH